MNRESTQKREPQNWLQRFHQGQRQTLEECYQDHFDTVQKAIGRFLQGADQETVIHDVFFRLINEPKMRQNFQGGSFSAWLTKVAQNSAIDFLRRYRREKLTEPQWTEQLAGSVSDPIEEKTELKMLIDRFCQHTLPKKWLAVFEIRFIRQLSQREAAKELNMHRTTLAYQEERIRGLLRRFVLKTEES